MTNLVIRSPKLTVTPAMSEHAQKQLMKIIQSFKGTSELWIKKEKETLVLSLQLPVKSKNKSIKVVADDFYQGIYQLQKKATRLLTKEQTKRQTYSKESIRIPVPTPETEEKVDYTPLESKPMYVEEAMLQAQLYQKEVFFFVNAETMQLAVIKNT